MSKGLILEQLKEPALSRDMDSMLNEASWGAPLRSRPDHGDILGDDDIIEIARIAQIIDERDNMPLHKKLKKARTLGLSIVAADAVDDEPYVSSQLSVLLHLPHEVTEGLRYCGVAIHAPARYIAVYKNIYDVETKIPRSVMGVNVVRIRGRYPAEPRQGYRYRKELRKAAFIGTGALVHLYRAIHQNYMQTTCFVTVAGNCIANPKNMEVSIGTPVMSVLERCGLTDNPTRIVMGGSMTGISISDPLDMPLDYSSRALLAIKEDIKERSYRCIGCGRCTEVCVANISPIYVYKCLEKNNHKLLELCDPERCIGCGTCSYVCPAKLELTARIYGYKEMKMHGREAGKNEA